MIDIETIGTGPDACILTIAMQTFDPFSRGWYDRHYYARIDTESQPDRNIEQGTLDWWATQSPESREEAFADEDRIPLQQALEEMHPIIWNSNLFWANGPTFDMNIIEHAYKSYAMPLPWKYYRVRDARTVYSLYPELEKGAVSHHALEDCRRQITLLQQTLKYLKVSKIL
jgi:hypothetical protein